MLGVLVVTGSSRGIGAATARLGAERGYAVCVNYHARADRARALVDAIARHGGSAIAVKADVSIEAEVEALFRTVDDRLGPVTHLVNNVGVIPWQCPIDEVESKALADLFACNVYSYFLCAREALRRMLPRHGGKGGAIVNVSSGAARQGGFNGRVAYAATKGAVETFSLGLAREVATEGVRVNCVRPGPTETEIHEPYGGAKFFETVRSKIPMQRLGRPEETATAILWLLSEEASFTTGTVVDVSGGQ